jgi:hypothetical protein
MGTLLKNKWWAFPLLLGVVLRLILMPSTYHPDLMGHSSTSYFFAYEGVTNIYDHLLSLPADHALVKNFGVKDIFIYPPLTHWTLGVFRVIVSPLADKNFLPWAWENLGNLYSYPTFGWQIFLFKLPYLFVDLSVAFLLAGLFDETKKKKWAFNLWLFNPVTLYATFMLGQLDILPVLFTVLSVYLIKKEKPEWAMLSLGIGAGYKVYPLLLLAPAAFILGKSFWEKVKFLGLGILPFFVMSLPYLSSPGYRSMVLFGPKSGKELFMIWNVSGAEGIFPFLLMLGIIYMAVYYLKKIPVHWYFLSVILLTLSVTHYHPQWFLWVTPFLIMGLVDRSFKYVELVILLLSGWFLITLFFEPSLSWGLFAPVNSELNKLPGLTDMLSKYTEVNPIKSMIRSVFAAAAFFYSWRLISEEKGKS